MVRFQGCKRAPHQRASHRFWVFLLAVFWLGVNTVFAQWSGGARPIQPPFPPNAYIPPPPPLGYPPQPPVPVPSQGNDNLEPWAYSDAEIQDNVGNEFATDPLLRPFGIHADVRNGVVLLTGTADTWQDATRAEIDAYAAGARAVDNRLRVEVPY